MVVDSKRAQLCGLSEVFIIPTFVVIFFDVLEPIVL
jgi:hypothetical protein